MVLEVVFGGLVTSWLGLTAERARRAVRFMSQRSTESDRVGEDLAERVTVLQPILGGDPTLEQNLRENLQGNPRTPFVWLLDDWDTEGRAAAAAALRAPGANPERVTIELTPDVRDGQNPKTLKLQHGARLSRTEFLAVLDDDTVLKPGGLAEAVRSCTANSIVTGLPYYVHDENYWSAQLSAFVNANVLLTYPVAADLAELRTINGMFYVVRADDLAAKGGFGGILSELTDDYAMALLYRSTGGRIVQSTVLHPIRTHVRDGKHYFSIMRRWMIFTHRFMRENSSPTVMLFIGVPLALPLLALVTSLPLGPGAVAVTLGALFAKGLLTRELRRRYIGTDEPLANVFREMVADVLLPIHYASGFVRSDRFAWRKRNIVAKATGELQYS